MDLKHKSKKRTGPKPAEKAEDAYNYAMWYLNNFGDTSESNLRTKLKNKTDNQEWIDFAINKVIEHRFQSDARYAEIIVRQGMETKSWGRSRIAQELMKKGIQTDIANEAMSPLDDDDPIDRATQGLGKKFRDRDIVEQKDLAKAQRFLATRGFDFDCISAAIKQHNDNASAE